MNLTPEGWAILAAFVTGLSGWIKVLLDARIKDSGARREEWYTEAKQLQTRLDTMDTAYKTRIDAMDASHKAEVRELQGQVVKAREDHYDMVRLQLNMTVQLNFCEQQVRELQAIVQRLDEHIVDLYVSIQQEEEAGPRILSRLKTARPAVLLRDLNITKGDPHS